MLRRGGADAAKPVGAGCGNTPDHRAPVLAQGSQQGLRLWVRRAAQANGVLPPRCGLGNADLPGQYQRERAGPKGLDQGFGKVWDLARKVGQAREAAIEVCHVHDQRVVRRAALGAKNGGYCGFTRCIGPQPVHRLGRHTHQATGAQHVDTALQRGRV